MARRYSLHPAILVDPNIGSIRIYKYTLNTLGNPEYIVLVVNPHKQLLKIIRSDKTDKRAYYLKQTPLDSKRSLEIFNRCLVRDLFYMNKDWDSRKAYRILGASNENGSTAKFKFSDAIWSLEEQE